MMLDFLNQYKKAVNLDKPEFNKYFVHKVKRSDFLLFEESTICEFKEIKNFNVAQRVEHISRKNPDNKYNFKRDLYKTIRNALHSANLQIKETKTALGLDKGLGLAILENKIPDRISILALIDAAEQKMLHGLENIDAVLCLDLVNTFVDENGSHIRPALIVTRDTEKSKKLYQLVGALLKDFGMNSGTMIKEDFNISKADQKWVIDAEYCFKDYIATINT